MDIKKLVISFVSIILLATTVYNVEAVRIVVGEKWSQTGNTLTPAKDIKFINITGAVMYGNISGVGGGGGGVTDHGALTGLADDDHTQYYNGEREPVIINPNGNIFIGYSSPQSITGDNNVILGKFAAYSTIIGSNAVVIGVNAAKNLGDIGGFGGDYTVIIGKGAAQNATGNQFGSVIIGSDAAGSATTTGSNQVIIGRYAGQYLDGTSNPTLVGYRAGRYSTGDNAAAFGAWAGQYNKGADNTFLGNESGSTHYVGNGNLYVGNETGYANYTGHGNVFIGPYVAGNGSTWSANISNRLAIDNSITSTPLVFGNFSTDVLTINGSHVITGSQTAAIFSTHSTMVLSNNHYFIDCDATFNPISTILPAVVSTKGRVYHVKKTDATANNCTVDGSGAETIDGAAIKQISTQYNSISVINNGSQWLIY